MNGTLTVNTVGGVATFADLSMNQIGTGYKLTANTSGLANTISKAFNIIIGAPAQLIFYVQPTDTIAGTDITPAVTVQVEDIGGNLIPTATNAVTVAIANNPGNSKLTGVEPEIAVAGVATFKDLTLNKIGIGYTLSASSPNLTGAISSAFNIIASAPSAPGLFRGTE